MKITLQKKLEMNGLAITKQIVIEIPDHTDRPEVFDAMYKALNEGKWLIVDEITP